MALMRYIGRHPAVSVRVLGEDFGRVEHGEILVVPDDLAAKVAWPESNWEAAETKKKETSK